MYSLNKTFPLPNLIDDNASGRFKWFNVAVLSYICAATAEALLFCGTNCHINMLFQS
jgi:hypothetical protein